MSDIVDLQPYRGFQEFIITNTDLNYLNENKLHFETFLQKYGDQIEHFKIQGEDNYAFPRHRLMTYDRLVNPRLFASSLKKGDTDFSLENDIFSTKFVRYK